MPDTGEVFDSSEGREPLTFLVGHRQMIPGFERELMGKELGEKVEFTLSPEDAYGEHNPDAIQQVPLEMFGGIKPEIGMTLMSDMGPFRVTEVGDELITVDFNHALAGKSLTFNVEVVGPSRRYGRRNLTRPRSWAWRSSTLRGYNVQSAQR